MIIFCLSFYILHNYLVFPAPPRPTSMSLVLQFSVVPPDSLLMYAAIACTPRLMISAGGVFMEGQCLSPIARIKHFILIEYFDIMILLYWTLYHEKLANLISKLNFYKLIPYPMDNCFTGWRDRSRQTPEKDVLYIILAGPVSSVHSLGGASYLLPVQTE